MNELIDQVIPVDKVIADARAFLAECEWKLEIGDTLVDLPENIELRIRSRAYIAATAPNVFIGDNFEVAIMLGCDDTGSNWVPIHGHLVLYYDLNGNFVSEDRYAPNDG